LLTDIGIAFSLAGGLILALGAALPNNKKISMDSSFTWDATMAPTYRFALAARHDARLGAWVLVVGFALQLADRISMAGGLAVGWVLAVTVIAVGGWWVTRDRCLAQERERFLAQKPRLNE